MKGLIKYKNILTDMESINSIKETKTGINLYSKYIESEYFTIDGYTIDSFMCFYNNAEQKILYDSSLAPYVNIPVR